VTGPFHGQFADRAHTVKYARQKKGGGLICIVLTKQASAELRKAKKDPNKVAMDGGEGSVTGSFGFKAENTFVSVAISEAKETWEYLRTRIEEIVFEDVAANAAAKAPATRVKKPPTKPPTKSGSKSGSEAEAGSKSHGKAQPKTPPVVEDAEDADWDRVLAFPIWQEAAYQYLPQGTRIRITGNRPDISYRIFELRETYDPSPWSFRTSSPST
jgi:hypothetical protein